ncbi:MAG: tRNA (5-methylaminomethyl-2-thiouridine)(34)-methyltransferase MnmD [Chlamydiota bacterium]
MNPKTPINYAKIQWNAEGAPFSQDYGDVYFSADGGHEETMQVFILGNNLLERWQNCSQFTIAEAGFGTGLNFLTTYQQWLKHAPSHGTLNFISFEKHPFAPQDLERLYNLWPQYHPYTGQILEQYPVNTPGKHTLTFPQATLHLYLGDIYEQLPLLEEECDAWFLDGFAPYKNPSMWSPQICQEIYRLTKNHGTFSTYSSARAVREALAEAGFAVSKTTGFASKKHMTIGLKLPKKDKVTL